LKVLILFCVCHSEDTIGKNKEFGVSGGRLVPGKHPSAGEGGRRGVPAEATIGKVHIGFGSCNTQ
jgi:hypothetical protein